MSNSAGSDDDDSQSNGGGGVPVQVPGASGGSGTPTVSASLFPAGLGSTRATPMFVQQIPTPKSVSISPYGNFSDLTQKSGKALWREVVMADDDQVRLDMNVTNSKAIIELFQDKAITFCWMGHMNIPTAGTGMVHAVPATTPAGNPKFNADISDYKNLVDDFSHITLEQVMAFASWFMGDEHQPRAVRRATLKMKYIDVNAPGNSGLVARFKHECRTVSTMLWHTIRNHLTATSFKALMVRKKDFLYVCEETGNYTCEGFTLLRMVFQVVKPNVIVDVKDLQTKMERITLLSADNNFHTLSTKLEELQQEINAEKGHSFCTDDKLLTELFRAAETTTNEAFALDIRLAKSAWITQKVTDKDTIIADLNLIYRNMIADGSWGKVSSSDSKIIALTTQMSDLKKQYANTKPASKGGNKKGSTKAPQEVGKNWRYTKKGETIKCPDTGATLKWCPLHGDGAYMPANHDHDKWLLDKKRKKAEYEETKAARKRVKFDDGASSSKSAKVKDEKHPSQLQLSSALRQSLVTQCSMTPSEADSLISKAYASSIDGSLKE